MSEVTTRQPAGTPIWIDLTTGQPEESRAFYAALFGWDYEIGGPEAGGYAMGRLGGSFVAGIGPQPAQEPEAPAPPATWTVYLGVMDVEATSRAITEHGGRVFVEPFDVLDAGRMALATDPTGAMFGLWQPGRHAGVGRVHEPGSLAWSEVNTRDSAVAGQFYADVFGYARRPLDSGDGFDYTTFEVDGRTVCGMLGMGAGFQPDVPPHWMIYFAVADTDAAVDIARRQGGAAINGPFDSTYGRIAVLRDPGGAMFSVLGPTAATVSPE
jgi:predicted enzyme related to lactoylglutathione lyase